LLEDGLEGAVHSSGPRCFHFVLGGTTPAALGADLWATVLDPIAYAWVSSPLAVHLEILALSWLRDLFGLPAAWSGVMVTGATMANFVGLAAARHWWGEQHGVDVSERGNVGTPAAARPDEAGTSTERAQGRRDARHGLRLDRNPLVAPRGSPRPPGTRAGTRDQRGPRHPRRDRG
jgi:glutamate/tyrosine decarboxylase-like PLP-dependent enzyme